MGILAKPAAPARRKPVAFFVLPQSNQNDDGEVMSNAPVFIRKLLNGSYTRKPYEQENLGFYCLAADFDAFAGNDLF